MFHKETQPYEKTPVWPINWSIRIRKNTSQKSILFTQIPDFIFPTFKFSSVLCKLEYRLNYLWYSRIPTLRYLRVLEIIIRKVISFTILALVHLILQSRIKNNNRYRGFGYYVNHLCLIKFIRHIKILWKWIMTYIDFWIWSLM